MTKILMRRGKGLKTLNLGPRISKFSDEARRTVTGKTSVRRLQRKAPAEALTDEKYASQFTNNANPKYQPTGVGPQSVQTVKVPAPPLGKATGRKEIKRPAKRWKRGRLS